MNGVPVKNACEALYIAVEMEKRAVRLYERAAMLWSDEAMADTISGMLADERGHLSRFLSMMNGCVPQDADALMLSAHAAGVLFEGGLNAAAREGAFASPQALLRYAAGQEAIAINCYTQFAAQCADAPEAQAAFAAIAQEEKLHLTALQRSLTA